MPTEIEIRNALLQELYCQENYALNSDEAAYGIADGYFTISNEELNLKYSNSKSKWKNRVQVVRNHLVNEGLFLPTALSGRDVWKLSDMGIKEARKIYMLYNVDDPHEEKLTTQVNQDINSFNEEEGEVEGKAKTRLSNYYERKPILRVKAIKFHGLSCKVCGFDFEKTYGELGKNFIEVHHLVPLSTYNEAKVVNPEVDMTVLCSNCHRMIHRRRNENTISLNELKNLIDTIN